MAGQLTVQTNLPGPGFWNGDSPATIKDGFEYCLAANIAHRAGLDKVVVQNVAWDALIAGQTRNFDLALPQITITEARKKVGILPALLLLGYRGLGAVCRQGQV